MYSDLQKLSIYFTLIKAGAGTGIGWIVFTKAGAGTTDLIKAGAGAGAIVFTKAGAGATVLTNGAGYEMAGDA